MDPHFAPRNHISE